MKIEAIESMALQERNDEGGQPTVVVPLKSNTNDKGTLFAGAIFSTCILCGYRAAERAFSEAGIQGDVVAALAEIKYRRPVRTDAVAAIHNASPVDKSRTQPTLNVQVSLRDAEGQTCATLTARYACVPPSKA